MPREAQPSQSTLQAKAWDRALLLLGQANIEGRTDEAREHAQEARERGCPYVGQWFDLEPKAVSVTIYGCAECGRTFGAGGLYADSACWVNGADGRHWHYQKSVTDPPRDYGWSGRWAKTRTKTVEVSFDG